MDLQFGHNRGISGDSAKSALSESRSSTYTESTAITDYSSSSLVAYGFGPDHEGSTSKSWLGEGLHTSNASLESYTSSLYAQDESPEDEEDEPPLEPPSCGDEYVLPSTSRDFAELFPSCRRIMIQHDDMTVDGNMNLRLDTPVTTASGKRKRMTLFHLRMHDLKSRDFSLRRYCRESGREICHTARKCQKGLIGSRPGVQRSLTNALASIRSVADLKSHPPATMKRQDSGYESGLENEESNDRPVSSHSNKASGLVSSDLLNLEFSNYSHVDLRRRGFKSDKRYDFDYWGSSYSWRKFTKKSGHFREVSYRLYRRNQDQPIAHIVPDSLSPAEVQAETEQGGWIPPCSMWIEDSKVVKENQSDLADVIVASGLLALVDDSIRRRFLSQETKQLIVPLAMKSNGAANPEYVGPKQLIDQTFMRPMEAGVAAA